MQEVFIYFLVLSVIMTPFTPEYILKFGQKQMNFTSNNLETIKFAPLRYSPMFKKQ